MITLISSIVVILEVIVYLIYVVYLIYRPIKMKSMKKKLICREYIIQNPPNLVTCALPRANLILCLPSIFVLYFVSNHTLSSSSTSDDLMGIFIYFSIFVILISLGFKSLYSDKGDYFLEEDGIHFIRNENLVIRYCDIKKSKWFQRNYGYNNIPINSMTKIVVNHRHFKIYNLTEENYVKYISSENIFIHPNKTSELLKNVIEIYTIAFICLSIIFVYFNYSADDGGAFIFIPPFVFGVASIVVWQIILNNWTIPKNRQ